MWNLFSFMFHPLKSAFAILLWSGCKIISGQGNTNAHTLFTNSPSSHCCQECNHRRHTHMKNTLPQQLSTMDLDPLLSHPHSHPHSQIPLYAQALHLTGSLESPYGFAPLYEFHRHTHLLTFSHCGITCTLYAWPPTKHPLPRIRSCKCFLRSLPACLWDFTGVSITSHMFNSSKT